MARTDATIVIDGDTRPLERRIRDAVTRSERQFAGGGTGGGGGRARNYNPQVFGKISGDVQEFNKSMAAANARVVAFTASAGSLYAIGNAMTSIVKATIQVEKQLADINSIFSLTSSGLENLKDSLFEVGKATGQSFDTVAEAAKEFSRQGLSFTQTIKATRDALILTRLSGLDATKSVEALTAAMNSFQGAGLDTTKILNTLVAVDAKFAVSAGGLAEAIQRVGSTADDAGVSFNELIALVTTAQQVTQRGGQVIGNSLKTILTRFQRGENLDLFEQLGIGTKTSDGQIRPLVDLLKDLANAYDTLGQSQRNQIAEQLGGVYQINILKSLVGNVAGEFSLYENSLKAANNATTEAINRNDLLNKTLATRSNEFILNMQKAASEIGKLTFEPAINNFFEFSNLAAKAIDGEGVGKDVATGILKGIGDVLAGPGLAFALAAVGKNLGSFIGFATKSLTSLFDGSAQRADLEKRIGLLIQNNLSGYQQTELAAAGVARQEEIILGLIRQQAVLRASESGTIRSVLPNISPRLGNAVRRSPSIIPNMADIGLGALSGAIAREAAAGVPVDAIRIGQNGSLKSNENPLGLGVFNTRDEPLGLSQGILRARREGLNPKTYGLPNFAPANNPFEDPTIGQNISRLLLRLQNALNDSTISFEEASHRLDRAFSNPRMYGNIPEERRGEIARRYIGMAPFQNRQPYGVNKNGSLNQRLLNSNYGLAAGQQYRDSQSGRILQVQNVFDYDGQRQVNVRGQNGNTNTYEARVFASLLRQNRPNEQHALELIRSQEELAQIQRENVETQRRLIQSPPRFTRPQNENLGSISFPPNSSLTSPPVSGAFTNHNSNQLVNIRRQRAIQQLQPIINGGQATPQQSARYARLTGQNPQQVHQGVVGLRNAPSQNLQQIPYPTGNINGNAPTTREDIARLLVNTAGLRSEAPSQHIRDFIDKGGSREEAMALRSGAMADRFVQFSNPRRGVFNPILGNVNQRGLNRYFDRNNIHPESELGGRLRNEFTERGRSNLQSRAFIGAIAAPMIIESISSLTNGFSSLDGSGKVNRKNQAIGSAVSTGLSTGLGLGLINPAAGLVGGAVAGGASLYSGLKNAEADDLAEQVQDLANNFSRANESVTSYFVSQNKLNDLVKNGGTAEQVSAALKENQTALGGVTNIDLKKQLVDLNGNLAEQTKVFDDFQKTEGGKVNSASAVALFAKEKGNLTKDQLGNIAIGLAGGNFNSDNGALADRTIAGKDDAKYLLHELGVSYKTLKGVSDDMIIELALSVRELARINENNERFGKEQEKAIINETKLNKNFQRNFGNLISGNRQNLDNRATSFQEQMARSSSINGIGQSFGANPVLTDVNNQISTIQESLATNKANSALNFFEQNQDVINGFSGNKNVIRDLAGQNINDPKKFFDEVQKLFVNPKTGEVAAGLDAENLDKLKDALDKSNKEEEKQTNILYSQLRTQMDTKSTLQREANIRKNVSPLFNGGLVSKQISDASTNRTGKQIEEDNRRFALTSGNPNASYSDRKGVALSHIDQVYNETEGRKKALQIERDKYGPDAVSKEEAGAVLQDNARATLAKDYAEGITSLISDALKNINQNESLSEEGKRTIAEKFNVIATEGIEAASRGDFKTAQGKGSEALLNARNYINNDGTKGPNKRFNSFIGENSDEIRAIQRFDQNAYANSKITFGAERMDPDGQKYIDSVGTSDSAYASGILDGRDLQVGNANVVITNATLQGAGQGLAGLNFSELNNLPDSNAIGQDKYNLLTRQSKNPYRTEDEKHKYASEADSIREFQKKQQAAQDRVKNSYNDIEVFKSEALKDGSISADDEKRIGLLVNVLTSATEALNMINKHAPENIKSEVVSSLNANVGGTISVVIEGTAKDITNDLREELTNYMIRKMKNELANNGVGNRLPPQINSNSVPNGGVPQNN